MKKLHQVVALIKGRQATAGTAISDRYKLLQRENLYAGMSKVYQKKDDEGVQFPPQSVTVQRQVKDDLDAIAGDFIGMMDLIATKDWANTDPRARGTVRIGTHVLVADAPVPWLLSLLKQLEGPNGIRTIFTKLPTLDPALVWHRDEANNGYRTDPVVTVREEKITVPLVLYPATDKHPAQTKETQKVHIPGHWETTTYSGAIMPSEKEMYIRRIDQLIEAIKVAVEEANQVEAEDRKVTSPLVDYILHG